MTLYLVQNNGFISQYTGTPNNWIPIDTTPGRVRVFMDTRGTLYEIKAGNIQMYIGNSSNPTRWDPLGSPDPLAIAIAGTVFDAAHIYKLQSNGSVWLLTATGWSQQVDNHPGTRVIANAPSVGVIELMDGGSIYWASPPSGNGRPQLDANANSIAIATDPTPDALTLYQLHIDGTIWKYTGELGNPTTGEEWTQLDNSPMTRLSALTILAMNYDLYQMQADGSIWQYAGTPNNWTQLDNTPSTMAIAADATIIGQTAQTTLYQLRGDGTIWQNVGPSWEQIYTPTANPSSPISTIIAGGAAL